MKFEIPNLIKENVVNSMRGAGYISLGRGNDSADFSFVRPLSRNNYPRFHVFVRFDQGKNAFLNIHLDQRKTVYSGATAHAADYDGHLVEEEAERIKSFLV